MMSKMASAPKAGFAKLMDWVTSNKKYVYYFNEGSYEEKGNVDSKLFCTLIDKFL